MRKRKLSQWLAALLSNSYLPGWLKGTIYQGKLKQICVPFLNCYSCPGALGACPVGAFQTLAAGFSRTVSLYIAGLLLTVASLGGRFVCGWLCPFGLVQELLYKKKQKHRSLPRGLEMLKFVVLGLTVLLPFFWHDAMGLAEPYFCKYICPQGTLGAGLPLAILSPAIASMLGRLFSWKVLILALVLLASFFYWRPFCRVLCPLGAFYGLFNGVSLWRLRFDKDLCIDCGACERQCKAALKPQVVPNSASCVRCLECVQVCPTQALTFQGIKCSAKSSSPVTEDVKIAE